MRAIVTKEFRGIGDHDKSERYYVPGEVIYGALADVAVEAGNAAVGDAHAIEKKRPAKKAKG